ncbi:MAG TPA: hypothetical protein VMQ60_09150, partial [Acidobacteriaceae bacterium]|nr:hypothetical protein [Acidobacteriaceae bacterium]
KEVVRVLCPSNRLNMPYWQLKKSDAYGPLRLKAHDVEINLIEGKHKTKLIAAYHPSFGRSAAQIDMLVEDSKLIAGCPISRFSDVVYSRRNSPHSTT